MKAAKLAELSGADQQPAREAAYKRLIMATVCQAAKDLYGKDLGQAVEAAIFLMVCGKEFVEAAGLREPDPLRKILDTKRKQFMRSGPRVKRDRVR